MQKITPFLWFNDNAEEAINFYISIFKDSKILSLMPGPNGSVMGATFQLNGQTFFALNGGPKFKFTEAISLYINCEDQAEVDYYWERLTANGGEESMCGWLKDKYGLSWQVIPRALEKLMGDKDREKANRVMMALLKMTRIEVKKLQEAYDQK